MSFSLRPKMATSRWMAASWMTPPSPRMVRSDGVFPGFGVEGLGLGRRV